MWTNKLLSNIGGVVLVRFLYNGEYQFTKQYFEKVNSEDITVFLEGKLNHIISRYSLYAIIESMVNSSIDIKTGWKFKFIHTNITGDAISILVETESPYQILVKRFNVTSVENSSGLGNYVTEQIVKVNTLIEAEDYEGLELYFGEEVTLDG